MAGILDSVKSKNYKAFNSIEPVGNRIVLLKELIKEDESYQCGSIYIPKSLEREVMRVVSIGIGEKMKNLSIKIGDILIIEKYSGQEYSIYIDGEEKKFLIVKVEDIVAKIL